MATVDEQEDEIIGTEVPPALQRRINKLIDDAPYVTTVLLGIEAWLRQEGDEKGARLVEQCTLNLLFSRQSRTCR